MLLLEKTIKGKPMEPIEKEQLARVRLSVDLPKIIHNELRMEAIRKNTSITLIVLRSIIRYLKETAPK